MAADYSYFRAEGLSLQAIETVAEANAELAVVKEKLVKKFGASGVDAWVDRETKRYTVHSFTFDPPQTPPAGWTDAEGKPLASGALQKSQRALPAPGSSDHFYIVNMAGLMERAAGLKSLERALEAKEMPTREVPEDSYKSRFFVSYSGLAAPVRQPLKPDGVIPLENFFDAAMTGGRIWKPDPLKAMELDGAWYIRVPNRPGLETPWFTPPDAVPVSYDAMLAADAGEQQKRFNRLRATAFIPNCS